MEPPEMKPDAWVEMNKNLQAIIDQRKSGESVVIEPQARNPEPPSMPKVVAEAGDAEIVRGLRELAGNAAPTTEPNKTEPEKKPIPGTPFYTVEALVEAQKHATAKIQELTLARRDAEAKLKEMEGRGAIDIQAEVKKALADLRPATPEFDPEADAKLKEDDPVKWEIEQNRRELNKTRREIAAELAEVKKAQAAIAEDRQLKAIESEYRVAAEASGIPYELLLGVGSTDKYAGKSAAEVAEAFKPELLKMIEGMLKKPATPVVPAIPGQPITRGASAVAEKPLTEEEVGPLGSEKWRKQTLPNIIKLIRQQTRG